MLKTTRVTYRKAISTLIVLVVTWLAVFGYGISQERYIYISNIKFVPRFQMEKDTPSLAKTQEEPGSSDEESCSNLPTGIPEIRPSYLPGVKNPCWYGEDGQLRCLPYFYLAGLPKSGTTDLYRQVTKHPDVTQAMFKEPHWISKRRFFVKNKTFHKRNLGDYMRFFQPLATKVLPGIKGAYQSVIGDGSASTLWYNRYWYGLRENCGLKEPKLITAHYIKYLLPRVKIMAIMRNPTDRLYSGYLFFANQGRNKSRDDFHNIVVNAINIFNSCLSTSSLRACAYNYTISRMLKVRLHIGLYDVYVQDWMNVFAKDQLHFIRFEDYIQNRLSAIKKIYQFLELRPLTPDEEIIVMDDSSVANSNKKKKSAGPMRPETRRLLDEFYRPHNEQLAKLLEDKGYLWK